MKRLKSFAYAFRGIKHCIKNERNMRIHTCVALYVLAFAPFFQLSIQEFAILLLTISAVLSAEMVNTAAEELSDLSAADYNPMARIAKDVAAGAVLICSIFAVVIGVLFFLKKESFIAILRFFLDNPVTFFLFLLSVVAAMLFIELGPTGISNKIKSIQLRKKIRKK